MNTPADEHAQVVKSYEESASVVIPNASFRIMLTDRQENECECSDVPVERSNQDVETSVSHFAKVGREVENMDESRIQTEYEALKKQFEDLQMRYNSLVTSLKAEIIDEIV